MEPYGVMVNGPKNAPSVAEVLWRFPALEYGGICGARWWRAVMDSQDDQLAHWIGGCNYDLFGK